MISSQTVLEDVKRALSGFLTRYFVGDNIVQFGGVGYKMPDCEFYYDIRQLELDKENDKPIVAIVGSRSNDKDYKCGTGIVKRSGSRRTVYVKVLNKSPILDPDGEQSTPKQVADLTWSYLQAVINSKRAELSALGLNTVNMTIEPDDVSNEQETLLVGALTFQYDTAIDTTVIVP